MPMTPELDRLVQLLQANTSGGKVRWEATVEDDVYRTIIQTGIVRIARAENGTPVYQITFRARNTGATVDSGLLPPTSAKSLESLYEQVHTTFLDSAITQALHELQVKLTQPAPGTGFIITAIHPERAQPIVVNEQHRAKGELFEVPSNQIVVRGTCRVKPAKDDCIAAFIRRGHTYYPQPPITFDYDRENTPWECRVYVSAGTSAIENEIIIARVSEDLQVAMQHYSTVHRVLLEEAKIDKWIGIELNREPPGLERLASLKGSFVRRPAA